MSLSREDQEFLDTTAKMVNPQYADQIGTESWERANFLRIVEELRKESESNLLAYKNAHKCAVDLLKDRETMLEALTDISNQNISSEGSAFRMRDIAGKALKGKS